MSDLNPSNKPSLAAGLLDELEFHMTKMGPVSMRLQDKIKKAANEIESLRAQLAAQRPVGNEPFMSFSEQAWNELLRVHRLQIEQARAQSAPAIETTSYEHIAEMLPSILASGTEKCPLCGKNGVHQHSPAEIIIYRNGCKYASRQSAPAVPVEAGQQAKKFKAWFATISDAELSAMTLEQIAIAGYQAGQSVAIPEGCVVVNVANLAKQLSEQYGVHVEFAARSIAAAKEQS